MRLHFKAQRVVLASVNYPRTVADVKSVFKTHRGFLLAFQTKRGSGRRFAAAPFGSTKRIISVRGCDPVTLTNA